MKKIYLSLQLALFFGMSAIAQTGTCDSSVLDFSFTAAERPTTCPVREAGSIEISIINGTGPFTTTISQIAAETGETLATIPVDLGSTNTNSFRVRADIYEATVTSADGCTLTKQLILNPTVNLSVALGDCNSEGRREIILSGTSFIPSVISVTNRVNGFVATSGVSLTNGASSRAFASTGINIFRVTSGGCTSIIVANIPSCDEEETITIEEPVEVSICEGVEAFDGSISYNVGDLVVFNNLLVEITRVVGRLEGRSLGSCDDTRSAKSLSEVNSTVILSNTFATASVFPNPFTEVLNIQTNNSSGSVNVVISNIQGQTVFNESFTSANIEANVSNLSSGIYFLNVVDSEGNVLLSDKVIK